LNKSFFTESQADVVHHQVAFQAASRARNLGVQHARGEWVGFPDDDCQFMPDTLIEIERLTRQSQISVVTGQTTDASGSPNLLRWRQEPKVFTRWTMFGCLVEATMYVRRDLFLRVKGFDERFSPSALFPAAESIELLNRLFAALGAKTRQMFALRDCRSAAFSARLVGLFKGFFTGVMVIYFSFKTELK